MGINTPSTAGGWNAGAPQQQMNRATAYAGAAGANECQSAVLDFIRSSNDMNGVHVHQVSLII